LFELQKPSQICHCLVFFANVFISNSLSYGLALIFSETRPQFVAGQSLVLLRGIFLLLSLYRRGRHLIVKHLWVKSFFLYFNEWVQDLLFLLCISCHASRL
jgi:hypothetical protein